MMLCFHPWKKEKSLSAFDAILSPLEGIWNDLNCHVRAQLSSDPLWSHLSVSRSWLIPFLYEYSVPHFGMFIKHFNFSYINGLTIKFLSKIWGETFATRRNFNVEIAINSIWAWLLNYTTDCYKLYFWMNPNYLLFSYRPLACSPALSIWISKALFLQVTLQHPLWWDPLCVSIIISL